MNQRSNDQWRTCRVMANRTRLKMLALVWCKPGQTLSVLARSVNITVGAGSQYVRALEAHGLLHTRRRGASMECWPASPKAGDSARELLAALRIRLEQDKKSIETAFKLVTAFTHPRRVKIYRALQNHEQTLGNLRVSTGISRRPLLRHLEKLRVRRFIKVVGQRRRRYAILRHGDLFGRALASFVVAS